MLLVKIKAIHWAVFISGQGYNVFKAKLYAVLPHKILHGRILNMKSRNPSGTWSSFPLLLFHNTTEHIHTNIYTQTRDLVGFIQPRA